MTDPYGMDQILAYFVPQRDLGLGYLLLDLSRFVGCHVSSACPDFLHHPLLVLPTPSMPAATPLLPPPEPCEHHPVSDTQPHLHHEGCP